jgi:hypothetical protein
MVEMRMNAIGMQNQVRRMQRELVVKVRRRLLERQAERFPLLAEQMIAEELARRPGYYAGGDDKEANNQQETGIGE